MALMEYCLVNIVLGDSEPPKVEKLIDPLKVSNSKKFKEEKRLSHFYQQNGRKDRPINEKESPIAAYHRQSDAALYPTAPPPPIQLIPPPPARPMINKLTPAQIRLRRAINIDRFSRVFFPFLFTLLNCTYWIMFYEYI